MSGKSATNATDIHLFYFLIALHIHRLYYSLVFQEHHNNVSRETLLQSSPTPFALQYGIISLQYAPFFYPTFPLFRFQLSPFPPPKAHQYTKKSIDFAISQLISTFALST